MPSLSRTNKKAFGSGFKYFVSSGVNISASATSGISTEKWLPAVRIAFFIGKAIAALVSLKALKDKAFSKNCASFSASVFPGSLAKAAANCLERSSQLAADPKSCGKIEPIFCASS